MPRTTSARALLDVQRAAFLASGPDPDAVRQARLQRVIDLLVEHHEALCRAMEADFGGRSPVFSLMNDVLGSLASLKHARDHLPQWTPREPRPAMAPFDAFGAGAWVQYQPKGVVGIIGTWNAPLYTLLSPLASVLAAGNRAVLKPSELTPRTAEVLAQAVVAFFEPQELAVVTGGADVGADFAAQPWDHLVFTGSTAVGRLVMQAAAANLVPVTLELGGKSPVLVGRDADIAGVAERIAVGKSTNGGQLCVAPDVVWVHASQAEALVSALDTAWRTLFPTIAGNADVVPVINERHFARVESYIADAAARGAQIRMAGGWPDARGAAERRMPLRVVIDPPADSLIMQHEIFGPALVLRTYQAFEDALAAVAAGPRPLALYWFGSDADEQEQVLQRTLSGGVSLGDVCMHPAVEDAPFGGVGTSGMGRYHGREGFLEFSHARTVYQAGAQDPRRGFGMLPPYSDAFAQMLRAAVTR
ncbi:coniferyl aldehyde dehydrogenase [Azohydromonas caseinilytica]|uniref:Aldehyde dehydrogenase n=1 Tax=Azohydromonas caseinilytica TaxID=2728836 RepID=A0A848FE74_9BURK|nr:coniferyl aldehyde dehydrogenase [Azohydromonas caseinilytica]NML16669.1 coniferyl aldehyde dehydrogenase [Azohydromonas caseinilytica]